VALASIVGSSLCTQNRPIYTNTQTQTTHPVRLLYCYTGETLDRLSGPGKPRLDYVHVTLHPTVRL